VAATTCRWAIFAHGAVSNGIGAVLGCGAPVEIADVVVQLIAVAMAAVILALGARTDVCLQH